MSDGVIRARPPEAVIGWAHEMFDQCHQQAMRDLGPNTSRARAREATISGCLQSIIAEAVRDAGEVDVDTLLGIVWGVGSTLGITFHRTGTPEVDRAKLLAEVTKAAVQAHTRLSALASATGQEGG